MGTLKELGLDKDVDLLMEFRQAYANEWKDFCNGMGYEHEVSE